MKNLNKRERFNLGKFQIQYFPVLKFLHANCFLHFLYMYSKCQRIIMTFFIKVWNLENHQKLHAFEFFFPYDTYICICTYLFKASILVNVHFQPNTFLVKILTISRENPATLWEHQGIGTLPAPRSGPAHHGHFYPWSVRPQLVKSWSSEVIWQIAMDQKHNLMVPGFSNWVQQLLS